MFTGIIEEIGTVTRIVGTDMTVHAAKVRDGLAVGDSVAVNGACLTAATLLDDAFVLQMSPETLRRTTLGALRTGAKVNLERAMTLGARLGGHLVLGMWMVLVACCPLKNRENLHAGASARPKR